MSLLQDRDEKAPQVETAGVEKPRPAGVQDPILSAIHRRVFVGGAAAAITTLVLPSAVSHASSVDGVGAASIELVVDDDQDRQATLSFYENEG